MVGFFIKHFLGHFNAFVESYLHGSDKDAGYLAGDKGFLNPYIHECGYSYVLDKTHLVRISGIPLLPVMPFPPPCGTGLQQPSPRRPSGHFEESRVESQFSCPPQ